MLPSPLSKRLLMATTALAAVLGPASLAGCGVPREALTQALAQTASTTQPATDDDVRTALAQQADAWKKLDATVHHQTLGGILFVPASFTDAVDRTTAAATREQQLITQHQDDPQKNRQLLHQLQSLWPQVTKTLQN